MQNTSTYIISCSFNWDSYKSPINFTDNIISLINCFNNLIFIIIAFILNNK